MDLKKLLSIYLAIKVNGLGSFFLKKKILLLTPQNLFAQK